MKPVDLWYAQADFYMQEALDLGCRQFTWHVAPIIRARKEIFSWVRAWTAAYGPVKMMLIDHVGAMEYSSYGRYEKPEAVYPTWAPDEDWSELIELMKENVADDPSFTDNEVIAPMFRPVKGQKHRVVVHRLPPASPERDALILQLRQVQLDYPNAELFLSGASRYSDLFGLGFKAVDMLPATLTEKGYDENRVALPTGRTLAGKLVHDLRYADWFDLIGMPQYEVLTKQDRIRFCILSAQWAGRHFQSVTPFVSRRATGSVTGSTGKPTVFMPSELTPVKATDFVLPARRRKLMRNVGIKPDEYDMFACDTCILHNACSLYREGSVCTVKGSDAVALADAFGTRNVDSIINALGQLTKRNAERLEDAMAAEEASGELDPEVTKLSKTVFDQGTKLAKLIDPTLAGGPKVQVNVGVGQGGHASISTQNPKELMASIVAELESSGIPREKIDSSMVKGVLTNMANVSKDQAVSTARMQYEIDKPKTIEGTAS